MKTDKKIERIKREIMGIVMAAKPSSQPNLINEQLERLDTEVQKAVEEAVRGFAYYLLKRRNKDEFWGLSEGEVERAMIVAKQYLESEEK